MDELKNQDIKKARWKWPFIVLAFLVIVAVCLVVLEKLQPKISPEPTTSNKEVFEIFPVRFEDFSQPAKMYGLWPYGVKGNNKDSHNEGHPGWDFELKKGSKIYAIGDLDIKQIHEGDKATNGETFLVIEAYSQLKSGTYHIVYHSVKNLEPEVKEGAKIRAGEAIAEVGYPLSADSAMIHFGIFQPKDSVGSCPTAYFSASNQQILDQILSISLDTSTGKPFYSACVGKIDGELYRANYPDQVQYLQGNEPFE